MQKAARSSAAKGTVPAASGVLADAGPSMQVLRAQMEQSNTSESSEGSSGSWLDRARQGLGRVGEGISDVASNVWNTATETVNDLYTGATAWHFEGREARNGPPPSREELEGADSEWQLLPTEMSVFHDNGVGEPELKYIHPDGREAVIDGDTGEHVTDPRYVATYNYVNPMTFEEVEGLSDLPAWAGSNIGHFVADVIPYFIGGNVRGEH